MAPVLDMARSHAQSGDRFITFATEIAGNPYQVLVCRKDLSEDVVYGLTRELLALIAETARTRDVGARLNPNHAPATPIPLHPGAARYHREREILH